MPEIAYLAETFGTDKLSAFRKSDMKSAFINLIGRVKDPKGQEKSVVYAAGITADEIKAFVAQKGLSSPLIARFVVQGADALDFEAMGSLFLHAGELRKDWTNIEEDLPILERILRLCDIEHKKMPLSEILPRDKERVHRFVENYSDVLSKFSIKVIPYPNGARLESTNS